MTEKDRLDLDTWIESSGKLVDAVRDFSLTVVGATTLEAAEVIVQPVPEPSLVAVERFSRYFFPAKLPCAS